VAYVDATGLALEFILASRGGLSRSGPPWSPGYAGPCRSTWKGHAG
jgi:hypothetical protein